MVNTLNACCYHLYCNFSHYSTNNFDVTKMKEAAKLFLGLHDFRSFMNTSKDSIDKVTRREMTSLDISEGNCLCYSDYSWPLCLINDTSDYKFYNIYIKSSGFLYRQVSNFIFDRFIICSMN